MTEWRKHDPHFLQNAKIVDAALEVGATAPLLALTLLDLNAIGDRRGRLGAKESTVRFLRLRLLGAGLTGTTERDVEAALHALEAADFLSIDDDGRIALCGWSEDEFGIRGRAPKPKDAKGCDRCGKVFKPSRKNNRFCSDSCRKRDHDEKKIEAPDASDAIPDEGPDAWVDATDGEREGRTESLPSRLEVTKRPSGDRIHSESGVGGVDVSLLGSDRQTRSYASTSEPTRIGDQLGAVVQGMFGRAAQ